MFNEIMTLADLAKAYKKKRNKIAKKHLPLRELSWQQAALKNEFQARRNLILTNEGV